MKHTTTKDNWSKVCTIIVLIGLAGIIVALCAGCKTTANPSGVVTVGGHAIDPLKTGKVVQLAAKYGALEAIRQKPETRQYFQIASVAVTTVIASGNYSTVNLTDSINAVTGNADVSIAIADALGLYNDFFGDLVAAKLDAQSPYTVPVLTGLAAGIQQAVDQTSP